LPGGEILQAILMKYIVILYLCAFNGPQPECLLGQVQKEEFNTYSECILEGYSLSRQALLKLNHEEINQLKLAIRFHCKEIIVEKI
jgi:hypothetical protein